MLFIYINAAITGCAGALSEARGVTNGNGISTVASGGHLLAF